jgi:acyl carrier protein
MDVQERVKQFIIQNFYVSDTAELSGETSLISSGYVDSTGMLELMAFLESEFDIRINEQEMVPENLETIARIGAFVARKKLAA